MLELNELLDIFNAGDALVMDEEAADACNYYSIEAQKITCELNYNFHDFDERRELFSKLIGKEIDEELMKKVSEYPHEIVADSVFGKYPLSLIASSESTLTPFNFQYSNV